MKLKKISYLLLLALSVACVLMLGGCGKGKHTHDFKSVVTQPTCTEDGYTTLTCSCGETKKESVVQATGHKLSDVAALAPTCKAEGYTAHKKCANCAYTEGKTVLPASDVHENEITILTYPTADAAGERQLKCKLCGEITKEPIEALSAYLPEVSDFIYALLDGTKYTLDATGAEIILFTKTEEYASDESTSSTSVSDHQRVAFKLAELVLDGTGTTVVGHIKIEAGMCEFANGAAKPSTFDEEASLYVYLNGDAVSAELVYPDGTKEGEDFSLNDEFYQALAQELGVPYEVLATGAFAITELQNYLPALEALIGEVPTISDDFLADLEALAAAVGADFITVETVGGTETYTVNVEALAEFLALVDDKTLAEILDDVFGAGSGDAVCAFIESLPDKTVGEIVDAAIAFTENYGVPVENTYFLVNTIIRSMGGEDAADFAIEDLIDENYDVKIIELVVGKDATQQAEFRAELDTVLSLFDMTIDEIYVMTSGAPAGTSIIDQLAAMIEGFGDALTAELVVDATTGALVSVNLAYGDSLNGVSVQVSENGIAITQKLNGVIESEISFEIEENGTTTTVEADILIDGDDYLDFAASYDALTNALNGTFLIRDYYGINYVPGHYEEVYDEYWDEYYEEWVDGYYESYAFGAVANGSFAVALGEGAQSAELVINVLYPETGEVNETFEAEFNCDADSAELICEVDDTQVRYFYELPETGKKEIGMIVTDLYDDEILVKFYVSELNGVYTVDIWLDGYDMLDLEFSESYIDATIYNLYYEYDPDTDERTEIHEVLAHIDATISETADVATIVATIKDAEMQALAEVTLDFTAADGNGKIEYEITADGETLTGEFSVALTELVGGGAELAYYISAIFEDEEMFIFDYVMTVTENLIAYDVLVEMEGEAVLDFAFDLETQTQGNKEIVIFSYDIGALQIDESYDGYYDDDNDISYEYHYTDYIYGAGQIKLTIER